MCNRRTARSKATGNPGRVSKGLKLATGCERDRPYNRAAQAGMNPAIGPAIPISKSAAREGIGLLMRMKAPSVPIRLGKGTKNGGVTCTREWRGGGGGAVLSGGGGVSKRGRREEGPRG